MPEIRYVRSSACHKIFRITSRAVTALILVRSSNRWAPGSSTGIVPTAEDSRVLLLLAKSIYYRYVFTTQQRYPHSNTQRVILEYL